MVDASRGWLLVSFSVVLSPLYPVLFVLGRGHGPAVQWDTGLLDGDFFRWDGACGAVV